MAGVFKRTSDKARGKGGKWTAWWIDEGGRKRNRAASADKGKSLELAQHLEAEARRVKEGIIDPAERGRREASLRPPADHVEDYRLHLLAKGDRPKHATHVAGAIRRLLGAAAIGSVGDLAPDRIGAALGRLRAARAPRTANHALAAIKAFALWLAHANRIKEVPRGLSALKPYSDKVDRKLVRRALSPAEIERLLAATEAGPPVKLSRRGRDEVWISGADRAVLYRIALGTGFRANEIRTLTPGRFHLDGDAPTITVLACYSKRGRDDVQPIRRDLAERLRPWLAGRDPDCPALAVPEKTAQLLRRDLLAAGIPVETAEGAVDLHALRHTFISNLIASGVDPKTVQVLARHSTITLTVDRYSKTDDARKRKAIEGI